MDPGRDLRKIVVLVSDGSMDGTKATRLGTRVVHTDQFQVLLDHLQQNQGKTPRAASLHGSP